MSGTIKRIDVIKNMAVFQDFRWAPVVRDKGNNVVEFKKINIFYGRNYSGKTTLSRIFRALETGELSEKFGSPEFQLSMEGGKTLSHDVLSGHGQIIRVFNEDFVKENLRFISDEDSDINSFAILGEDNAKLEEEIVQHQIELGSEENKTGLLGKKIAADSAHSSAKNDYDSKSSSLETKLREKANKTGTGIKHNKVFGNATYNISSIKADIITVGNKTYTPTSFELAESYHKLLKEESKQPIDELPSFDLLYSAFVPQVKSLVEKKIQTSDPIQDLLDDAFLDKWVREGREFHQEKRTKCGFCGNTLPNDLWDKLDKHFNKESGELRDQIEQAISEIEKEKERIPNLFKIETIGFYANYHADLELLRGKFKTSSKAYIESLDTLKKQLEKRKGQIFTIQPFTTPESIEQDLLSIWGEYEALRKKSNTFTNELSGKQSKARTALRLHEVLTFVTDIKYHDECAEIKILDEKKDEKKVALGNSENAIRGKQGQINALKNQLKDENQGADKVNEYLNCVFGHESLSLKAIANTDEDATAKYRFEVTRNGNKASHLSEGESSLIAFCYFMAKLKDHETDGHKPIIWIDDPISSLDANHVFFVYSLINAEIVKRKQFQQLFLSTHNLDFLKYLKRISNDYQGKGDNKVKIREFFLIERGKDYSRIVLMPNYLKNYVTEFNYLFHQIYKCATEDQNDSNHHVFYNFGNNARKFLEIFLYYKYPSGIESNDKLEKLFGGDKIPPLLTDRINNEYSHMCGVFERGATPVESPEMKSVAKQILSKIKEDQDQYEALLKSIGIKLINDPLSSRSNTQQENA